MAKQKQPIRTGKRRVRMVSSSHVPGVAKGGRRGSTRREVGVHIEGSMAKGTARRSTGINADRRNPIDPESPNLSPS